MKYDHNKLGFELLADRIESLALDFGGLDFCAV